MDTRSITLSNLESGEVYETDLKNPDNKHIVRGSKMYNRGIEILLSKFTNKEVLRAISMFSSSTVDYNNILTVKFSKLFPDMDPSHRSKFKRKLLDNGVIAEYNKKIMLNPFIFISIGDKNIKNCRYLTQQVWKYLFEDTTSVYNDVEKHAEHIFGNVETIERKFIRVGSGDYSKLVPNPNKNNNNNRKHKETK